MEIRTVTEDSVAGQIASSEDSFGAIILLGRRVIESEYVVTDDTNLLLGGYTGDLNVDHDIPRISLNIDPAFAIASANGTGDAIVNVRGLHNSLSNNNVEIDALENLNNADVILEKADGERETARGWFDILNKADAVNDAIWILDEKYLDNTGTYRYLIETAWRRKMLVISTIPSLSNRGVSVGFIPVLSSYGDLLVATAKKLIYDDSYIPPQLLGGDTVTRVFNSRTLQRIGRYLPDNLDRGAHTDIVIE
ncbi:hypothetical protein OAM69_02325 [bacterium]|nr:hypothetical protein [bacterium]